MKTKLFLPLFFLLCLSGFSFANDGVFYASGNTLVPLQETVVQLKKEVLKFYVVDHEYVNVEIEFDFFNPGAGKSVTVGFVTPPAIGDISDEDTKHPYVSDFTVGVNGEKLEYKIKKMSETSFKMGDARVGGDDFVYYFPVSFKKGANKIIHTYRFRGGSGIDTQRNFSYQITTGKRWANRQIDDFELQIHPDNGIFAVPASFQKTGRIAADWKIVGDGVIETKTRQWFTAENPKIRLAHLNSGYLSFKAVNFKPDNDLFFGEYNWPAGWVNLWCDNARNARGKCRETAALEKIAPFLNLRPANDRAYSELTELSVTELKLLRNYFYAVRGLPFKEAALKNFYAQFFWYKPNAGVTAQNIRLTPAEEKFIEAVKLAEKRLVLKSVNDAFNAR